MHFFKFEIRVKLFSNMIITDCQKTLNAFYQLDTIITVSYSLTFTFKTLTKLQ